MKVLLLNKFHYVVGGSEVVYFNTGKLLEAHGHEVIYISMKDDRNLPSPYSDYFVDTPDLKKAKLLTQLKHLPSFYYNRASARNLEKLIQDEKPDIAHIHLLFNGLSLSILPVLKKYNIPIVMTVHDYRFLCRSSQFMMKKECLSCNTKIQTNTVRYLCNGKNGIENILLALEAIEREYFLKHYKYIDKYIFVSQYQIGIHKQQREYFNASNSVYIPNSLENVENMKPNHQKGNYILYCGRLTQEKGVETFMKAAALFSEIPFKLVGEGNFEKKLRSIASPNCEFLGFRSGKELADIFREASFVVVPSEWQEVMGLVVIEAMAYGKPVIASRVGGMQNLIVENENGWLFEAGNLLDLESKINKALALTDEQYTAMSVYARQYAQDNFNSDIYYSKLLKVYEELMEAKMGREISEI